MNYDIDDSRVSDKPSSRNSISLEKMRLCFKEIAYVLYILFLQFK